MKGPRRCNRCTDCTQCVHCTHCTQCVQCSPNGVGATCNECNEPRGREPQQGRRAASVGCVCISGKRNASHGLSSLGSDLRWLGTGGSISTHFHGKLKGVPLRTPRSTS